MIQKVGIPPPFFMIVKKDIPILLNRDIRHVSFDFWGTLAESNPEFKRIRLKIISDSIGQSLQQDVLKRNLRSLSLEHNALLEAKKQGLPVLTLYDRLLSNVGGRANQEILNELYSQIESIFLLYPPLLSHDALELLLALKRKEITISLTSNVAFIKGSTIHKFLNQHGLDSYFEFMYFSDQQVYGKPHEFCFNCVYEVAKSVQGRIRRNQVLHVGDNFLTDGKGAKDFGFQFYQV